MRSLFVRVFLTFWLASALTLVSLAGVTAATNARPLSHRWLVHTLDLYANTAIDAYEHGGIGKLSEYLSDIRGESRIAATLLSNGTNLSANDVPPQAVGLLNQARVESRSQFSFATPWLGVIRHQHGENVYFFVAQVPPVRMFGNFIDPEKTLFRLALLLLISGTLCGLLARSITDPVRSLQRTAMEIAAGDLAARASPKFAGRKDELTLLAHDFDRMAERVQLLINQQKLLLRDISHELRSPLARLTVSTELVRRGDLTATSRMQADISTLENMISNLLTLARIDASEEHCRREPVHMGRLLQQIVRDASFEGIAGNKSVVQTGHFDLYAMGDTGLLHSCVENVVRNALKHTPPGGLVEVSLTESSNHGDRTLNITTSDEGKGVPGDSLEQIFDPFFRIASSGTHEWGGAGLGLSISKRIVSLYGGTIAAQNLASSGLRVTITLPAA